MYSADQVERSSSGSLGLQRKKAPKSTRSIKSFLVEEVSPSTLDGNSTAEKEEDIEKWLASCEWNQISVLVNIKQQFLEKDKLVQMKQTEPFLLNVFTNSFIELNSPGNSLMKLFLSSAVAACVSVSIVLTTF